MSLTFFEHNTKKKTHADCAWNTSAVFFKLLLPYHLFSLRMQLKKKHTPLEIRALRLLLFCHSISSSITSKRNLAQLTLGVGSICQISSGLYQINDFTQLEHSVLSLYWFLGWGYLIPRFIRGNTTQSTLLR